MHSGDSGAGFEVAIVGATCCGKIIIIVRMLLEKKLDDENLQDAAQLSSVL